MKVNKIKVIKDFEKLSVEFKREIKQKYPLGFGEHLIQFSDIKGNIVNALPYETEDKYYLIRIRPEFISVHEPDENDIDYEEVNKSKRNFKEENIEDSDFDPDFISDEVAEFD